MRVAWVHPSWRDLVVEHLSGERAARARFLSACGPDGVSLALAVAGGPTGERRLPLLREDADWDLLTGRVATLIAGLDPPVLLQILAALEAAVARTEDWRALRETRALASFALDRIKRGWDEAGQPLDVGLLEAWFDLAQHLPDRPGPPRVARTWSELIPARAPDLSAEEELDGYDQWLRLAGELKRSAPAILKEELRFPRRYRDLLLGFWQAVERAYPTKVSPSVLPAVVGVMNRFVDVGLFSPGELSLVIRRWSESGQPSTSPEVEEPPHSSFVDDGADVARILRDL